MTKLRQEFINQLTLHGFSTKTIRNYIQCVAAFAKHYNASPLTFTNEQVKEYLLYLINVKHLEPKTINLHRYSIKSFYNHFCPNQDMMRGTYRVKEPLKIPVILSRCETKSLIDNAYPLKMKAVVAVLYSSGIRLNECVSLKITDIDRKRMVFRSIPSPDRQGGFPSSTSMKHFPLFRKGVLQNSPLRDVEL